MAIPTPQSAQEHRRNTADDRHSFVISTLSFSMILMGWGGANGAQALA